ncbi:Putative UPF0149 protein HSM_1094 [Avibacterium paragallinarum JF4211]|uniref:UPF0149 protein NCTC11296_00098 n=1 Tax=Avibacterium paragallinarum TaxID=728 RepID=A0A377I4D0_AVIPA|nr:YecA family protein [Avibacterium paragallinarum]RZN75008.1 YecA family protein [Avibacterium paragallinarum]CDF98746.1 Putative UPF0149 protein HSM_1094 [Avibacterium paragallinarum JF4211]STO70218.1 yecA family protein [Avibacterium paragallinarum]
MSDILSYDELALKLRQASIPVSAAELHGFLTGLICGGASEQKWPILMNEFTNNGEAYPTALLKEISALYHDIHHSLEEIDSFNFHLYLPESDVFDEIDALAEWTSHFLLGLGLLQTGLDKEKGEIGEALDDLQNIAVLTYQEEDAPEELADSLEQVAEYVRTLVAVLYAHYRPYQVPQKTVLH